MPNSTTLKNRQGSILYPKTQASITYMSNGNSVEAEINDLRQYEHNDKGYFTTEAELLQEYPNNISNPEIRAGWHAVVGETDTIWIWDVDNNQWSNSGNITSAVTSVNGKVGDVTLRGQDINATATIDTTSVTKTVTGHLNDIYSELEETVTTDTDQVITGTKTFTNVIGLLNEDAGQVDQIKHINNNFLITSGTGTNLLNIDEGLETISSFNRQLAFEDEIEEIQGHYVSYDQQTGKTEAQKAQARANIGAGTSDIDTVKVNGVAQPIENGSVNITLPEPTQSIPILENASVWELEEGWYIFKKYVTLSQLYQIRHQSNSTENGELLGYVSISYVNTSNNNRLTKNLLLFCAETPNNSQVIPVNLKSIAVASMIEVSEGSIFDLWENVKYDDFVTLGTGQTITGAKNFTGILNKGGKAVATEEYVNANGGKIDTISVNGINQTITNKNVNLYVVESEDYLESTGIAELPIKYVKDKDGRFIPITSPKAVIDENGKSIDEIFAKNKDLPTNYVTTNTYQTITSDKSFQNGFSLADKTTGFSIWNIGLDNYTNIEIKNGANLIEGANIIFKLNQDGTITVTNVTTGTTKTFATLNDIPNLSNYYTKTEILNALYPIGTIYLTTSTNGVGSSSPASWLGGTWERLPEGYALWTASSGAGGTIGAGLPNITGYLGGDNSEAYRFRGNRVQSGALYTNEWTSSKYTGNNSFNGYNAQTINFDASRSNSIYGASSTVQPPAYKVYAWRRTA